MRTAFVTGGSGHVGGNLVRLLLKKGWTVRCLIHKDMRALEGLNIEKVKGDLLDADFLCDKLSGCDAVFHAAAQIAIENVDIELMHKINVEGTRSVTRAALEAGVNRFIHFSSIHAYEQTPIDAELNESRPLVSRSNAAPYDASKAEAERVVLEAFSKGLKTVIINPTGILGPHDYKPSRMGKVISDISKKKMRFTINAGFDWVDVRDVCEAAIKSVDQGTPGESYIISGKWTSFRDLSQIIGKKIEKITHWVSLPFWTAYMFLPFAFVLSRLTGRRPSYSLGSLHALAVQPKTVSSGKARKELNHQPRSIDSTVEDTINWNNAHAG